MGRIEKEEENKSIAKEHAEMNLNAFLISFDAIWVDAFLRNCCVE